MKNLKRYILPHLIGYVLTLIATLLFEYNGKLVIEQGNSVNLSLPTDHFAAVMVVSAVAWFLPALLFHVFIIWRGVNQVNLLGFYLIALLVGYGVAHLLRALFGPTSFQVPDENTLFGIGFAYAAALFISFRWTL